MMRIAEKIAKKYNIKLSDESERELNLVLDRNIYPKGEIILNQNTICTDIYIIEKGIVRQFYYKDGRDVSEHFSCEGDLVFSIESLFLKEPTTLLMEALEASVIYQLNYSKFQQLCDQNIDINMLYRRIVESDLIVSQRKADLWRFENARERYLRFCKEYPEVVHRAPVAHIATYLLMTPETLSRVRSSTL